LLYAFGTVQGIKLSSATETPSNLDRKLEGGFHDRTDAEWIVIRGPLRGHNDTPFGRPTPGWPVDCPGLGRPQGVFGVFSYCELLMLFLNMVCLTVALAGRNREQTLLRHRHHDSIPERLHAAGQRQEG
jgi:hypothetical protein